MEQSPGRFISAKEFPHFLPVFRNRSFENAISLSRKAEVFLFNDKPEASAALGHAVACGWKPTRNKSWHSAQNQSEKMAAISRMDIHVRRILPECAIQCSVSNGLMGGRGWRVPVRNAGASFASLSPAPATRSFNARGPCTSARSATN